MHIEETQLKDFIIDSGLVSRADITAAEGEAKEKGGSVGKGSETSSGPSRGAAPANGSVTAVRCGCLGEGGGEGVSPDVETVVHGLTEYGDDH